MYQRALEGYEKALGRDHTSTLNTVNNLGLLYADQGRPTEAESMYQRALSGFRVALGLSHWKTQLVIRDVLPHAKGPSAITEPPPPKAKVKILEKLRVKFRGFPKERRRPPS
jgi:tetratricopeptide (TPR) repeat protein